MDDRHPARAELDGFEALQAGARRAVLEHAAGCRACRERLLADDPTRAFALLSLAPVPAEALERLSEGVARRIDEAGGAPAPWWRRHAAAAVAAALLLAGGFGGYLLRQGGAPERPGLVSAAPAPEIEALLDERAPAEGIQLLSSPGTAEVLDLSVGDTQIVMIFDEELDI